MLKRLLFATLAVLLAFPALQAQDKEAAAPVYDVFYGTRTVNLQTTRQLGKKVLSYRISHRLGDFDSGLYNFWGLDGPASISLAFDYGILDNLTVGIGRNSLGKLLEGYVKWGILKQDNNGGSPVNLALYSKANMTTLRDDLDDGFEMYDNFAHRMSYITQILVSRKFGERFSLQIAPTFIHYNLVDGGFSNDVFAISASGQYKIGKKLGLSAEYSYVLNEYVPDILTDQFYNSLAVGLDIVTGGHCFQIHLINSSAINDAFGIGRTTQDLTDGKFRIGFNISRDFWF